jgi:SAF domain
MQLRSERAVVPRYGSRVRIAIARRPWIRWLVIAGLSIAAGSTVAGQLRGVEAARSSWAETVVVFTARQDLAPGEALSVTTAELPIAAVPKSALTEVPIGMTARQRIAVGEVVVAGDVTDGVGPAAQADTGTVVVPVRDPLVVSAPLGARVGVFADGIVLAASAKVVHLDADVVFIAVDSADGPVVAAAAQMQTASIVFLP